MGHGGNETAVGYGGFTHTDTHSYARANASKVLRGTKKANDCDNPVVGKHLDGVTRLLAEILLLSTICIRVYISLFQSKIVITTPQPPYGGSYI